MRNFRFSFSVKLFLATACIVLIVSISIYMTVVRVFEEKMRENTHYQLEKQVKQTVQTTDFYLDQLRSIYLNMTSDSMLIQTFAEGYNPGLNPRLQYPIRKMDTLSAVYNWVYTIYIYDPETRLFFNSNSLSTTELIDDVWLQNAMEDKGMYHFIVLEENTNLISSVPVRNLSVGGPIRRYFSGEPVAYFSLQVNLETLKSRIFPPSYSTGTLYAMYDGNGNHLFGDLLDRELPKDIPHISPVVFRDEKYIQFAQTSEKYKWTFFILTPSAEIYSGIDQIRTLTVPLVGISLVCALLLSYFLAWRFTHPIRTLTRSVTNYRSKGTDYDTIVNMNRRDEFQVLNNGLIDMASRINHLIDDVYQGRLKRKEMELQMLYRSMDPHFIYNVLNSINWQVTLGKNKEAGQALIALSRYLRSTMFEHSQWTTLERSGDEIFAYTRLQSIFYSEEIHCHLNFPDELLPLCIPSMILQPVIENCYVHGYPEGYEAGPVIEISAYRNHRALIIVVCDNGAGIPPAQLMELQKMLENEQVFNIGERDCRFFALRNVQSRIRIQCGREWGIRVESEGRGTQVTIKLPIKQPGEEKIYVEADDC